MTENNEKAAAVGTAAITTTPVPTVTTTPPQSNGNGEEIIPYVYETIQSAFVFINQKKDTLNQCYGH